ncbi:hypothetical protein ACW9HR_36400 [Nocardia gipuzkoensis]
MHSLEQRYIDLIDTAKRLGHDPDPQQIRTLREELDQLDYELRISVPAGHRYYTLNMASREADTRLTAADTRAQTARNVAAAERARELHDAQHPTVLSPQRSALSDYTGGNAIARTLRDREDRGRER